MQLDIEVDQQQVDKYYETAYRRLAAKARVPGFRPGKAPRAMVEKAIGRQRIMGEALDDLVPVVYNEAIEQHEVEAIDQPTLDELALDPVRMKFSVPVRPTIDLGDYRSIRVAKDAVTVTDDDVNEQIQALRRRHAIHVPVDRPAQWGDILIADVRGKVENDEFIEDLDAEFALREDGILLMPGMKEVFVGMSKGEEKSADIDVPADFRVEAFREKVAHFDLKVSEVKEEQLPDEDDEFAASVNDEFESVEKLRERIREDLTTRREQENNAAHTTSVIEKLVEGATMEYPAVLIEREIDTIVREMTGQDTKQYENYLLRLGKTEAEFRSGFRDVADTRVRRALAVSKLTEAEQIEVTLPEIDAEIDRIIEPMGENADRFREIFNTADGRTTVRRDLTSQRTMERLSAIAAGEAPALPEAPVAAEPVTEAATAAASNEANE